MNNLEKKINDDLKAAMLDKNADLVLILRMMVSALRNKEISLRQGEGKVELTDEQVVQVLSGEVKKRNDSIELFNQGGRPELAEKEEAEVAVIKCYLPIELSDEELERIVREIIADIGSNPNFGQVMGMVMARVKGQADGNRVSAAVKKVLS
jgi:uncharacterized protein YqeY